MKRLRRVSKTSKSVDWAEAGDIKKRSLRLIKDLKMDWVIPERIFFYRSINSRARAYARTWGLPALWQRSLKIEPAYIIEVLSEYFDKLNSKEQDKIILHELTHIPKNFSGALVPHTRRRKGSFKDKLDILINRYLENHK